VPISHPVLHRDVLVIPSPDGTLSVKKYVAAGGAPADLDATAPAGMYATVYKDRTILGVSPATRPASTSGPAAPRRRVGHREL
jgi:hypothetical protein